MSFYDDIADQYDEITGAAGRAESARAFVRELDSRHEIASAVDAACGSGLYALLLAEGGARVIGADISAGMLAEARRRGQAAGAEVEWVQASMQDLAGALAGPLDAALCMGNSLPHLLADADLEAALASFARVLRPGGVLAVQILNYARVLARGERVVGIDRHQDRFYVRFYDFLDERVRFNILAVDLSVPTHGHALHTTTLRPYTLAPLAAALARHGFADVQAFGDLRFGPFEEGASDMLVLTARTLASLK